MKKRYGVSKDDYEWLQYNCLVEISDKLTKVLKVLGYNEESHTKTTQLCTKCNNQMIWATLTNKWICIECGNVLTIDEILCSTNTQESQS